MLLQPNPLLLSFATSYSSILTLIQPHPLLLYVATTSSSIILCCCNLILYFLCCCLQPPLLFLMLQKPHPRNCRWGWISKKNCKTHAEKIKIVIKLKLKLNQISDITVQYVTHTVLENFPSVVKARVLSGHCDRLGNFLTLFYRINCMQH